uniref:Uncharacterized protein n=1 Tax=Nelumbo nucifera TaxID=4432 RepID=A0A822XCX6_NELNU|nr:TPA_asm: hypothetical protein HUJ06_020747 [Nelumbo nucifera]
MFNLNQGSSNASLIPISDQLIESTSMRKNICDGLGFNVQGVHILQLNHFCCLATLLCKHNCIIAS